MCRWCASRSSDLTERMTEYVVLHVLMHHRQELYLRESQREKRWAPKSQWAAGRDLGRHHGARHARRACGRSAQATRLSRFGLEPEPKSRSPASNAFRANHSSNAFLRQTDILVCLLPLTADTRHILNRGVFEKLNRNSPLGAPVLINAGRGGLQNEADILQCLDDGTLGGASLDVYATEPLPADSPFWTHPKVVLTPHNAADTDPDEISKYVARQIERFEAGGALENVVDRKRGYCSVAPDFAGTMRVIRPDHHVDRAVHDRFQFLARNLGAGADRDGVDGGRRELRQHRGIGARGQFALLFRQPEAGGERLVEFDKTFQHHGADLGIGHRFRRRRHHREAAARAGFARQINVERDRIDALQPLADRQFARGKYPASPRARPRDSADSS